MIGLPFRPTRSFLLRSFLVRSLCLPFFCASFFWVALVGFSASMLAAESVEVSRSIEAGGAVRVDIAYGRLRVIGAQSGRVRVAGEIGPELRGISLGRDAGAVEVRVRFPLWSRIRALFEEPDRFRVDLLIEVPVDTRLMIVSRDAEIEVEGIEGPVRAGVVSSEVVVKGRPERLIFEAVSGSLDFDGRTPSVEASTLSGRLRVVGVEDTLQLEAVTGSLEVAQAHIRRATLLTVSGDISIDGRIEDGGRIDVETESGQVTLRCCGPEGAELDLESRSGEISSELDEAQPTLDDRGRHLLEMSLGEASGLARVRTGSGNIRLLASGVSASR